MLNRLRAMQASFPTYEHDLTGGERVLPLEELRPWVAYPTNAEEQQPGPVSRRYLAVRDVRIDCPFPHAQVRHLGIVDLPGLGEFAARADQHHVGGLQNEVDVVLMVKRPVEGMAYWGDADARALDLIDSARGFADRRDFVFLVLNTGDTAEALVTALRDHIRGQVNSGVPDQFFRVLECDAADPGDVFARVLAPVLDHLAARMPAMDADALEGTRAELRATAQRIGTLADDLARVLASVAQSSGSVAEDLDLRSRRLRQDLSGALVGLVGELRAQARAVGEDQDYTDAVERAYAATRAWITGGLGVGEQAWRDEALRSMTVDRNSSRYAGDELNRVRVEISSCFEEIDVYFAARVRALWERVAAIVREHRERCSGRTRQRARTPCAGSPRCSPAPPSPARGCGGPSSSCSASGWTTAPSCTRGCAPSSTGSPCRSATRSPASSATGSSSRSRRTAPSSCTPSSCRWPSRPRT